MRRLLPALCVLAVVACCAGARADGDRFVNYQLDLGQSVFIPIGDSDYKRAVDPSYAASLRFAALFRVALPAKLNDFQLQMRLGPFFQIEGVAVNTADSQFQDNGLDARYGRLRVLVGPHIGVRLTERVDVWFRLGFGLDYADGSVHAGSLRVASGSSTAFALEPALGTTVRVWRMLTLGGSLSFPIAFDHDFLGGALASSGRFTAADVALTLLVGVRL